MTAVQIRAAVERAKAAKVARAAAPVVPQVPVTVQAVGGTSAPSMSFQDIQAVLVKVHGASGSGVQDGTRVHIHYESFGKPTPEAIRCASHAEELGLPRNRYTGRVHRVWKSKEGDLCLTLWVELERDHMYRTLNLMRGKVYRFLVLGE